MTDHIDADLCENFWQSLLGLFQMQIGTLLTVGPNVKCTQISVVAIKYNKFTQKKNKTKQNKKKKQANKNTPTNKQGQNIVDFILIDLGKIQHSQRRF